MPQNYKVNAEQVQVVDKNSLFVSKDVENVLKELFYKVSPGGGGGSGRVYTELLSEYPSGVDTFFQSSNIKVVRSDVNNSHIIYNGAGGEINCIASGTGDALKTITFEEPTSVRNGAVRVKANLNDVGDELDLILNRQNNSYYQLKIVAGSNALLYLVTNNIPLLIGTYATTINNGIFYDFLLFRLSPSIFFYVNGVPALSITNGSGPQAGKSQIIMSLQNDMSREVDFNWFEIGQVGMNL